MYPSRPQRIPPASQNESQEERLSAPDPPPLRLLVEPETSSSASPVAALSTAEAETLLISIQTLIAHADPHIRETFSTLLTAEGYEVKCVASAEETRAALSQFPFDILLCATTLPGQAGMEMLAFTNAEFPEMPVILIVDSGSTVQASEALHQGASDVINTQSAARDLPTVVERNLTRQTVQRVRALRHKTAPQTTTESILDALLSALNTYDTEPTGHLERVTAYTMEMADRMGLSAEERHPIERGALLHDIGKIGIPDRILRKPDALTFEEWTEMKQHPVIGYEMCGRIAMLKEAAKIVLHHHEAWDGTGYPGGLKGKEIPLGARLFALADTLDAITSEHPYRPALSFSIAREEIVRYSGTQFDPEIVALFLSVPVERWEQIQRLAEAVSGI